ncbi:MAG TPA: inositol monophosphatase family protein [Solirubrobacteraceae bacterium]|nr:inositol monophosphatase family protein [Solirubrobacteraceae bacterium]
MAQPRAEPAQPSADALLELAHELAHMAGAQLRERFERGHERAVRTKSTPTDLVSEADLASERAIRNLLSARRPDDGFLGEEGGASRAGSSGLRWVVDPLDGTVNFLFGIPQWCVSVAVEDAEGALAGVIFDPMRGETFAALREGPATLNGARVAGSTHDELSTAMVATGFAYDAEVRAAQAEVLTTVLPRVRDVRRMGSAALDLAWTAAGRYDAFYERTVKPWDIAAGVLICERAGLEVRMLEERPRLPAGVLAAAPGLVGPLLELVG